MSIALTVLWVISGLVGLLCAVAAVWAMYENVRDKEYDGERLLLVMHVVIIAALFANSGYVLKAVL